MRLWYDKESAKRFQTPESETHNMLPIKADAFSAWEKGKLTGHVKHTHETTFK